MPEQNARVWWCAIDPKWSSYDELKNRNAVAQGWPDKGDLSHVVGQPREQISNALGGDDENLARIFHYLLTKIGPGDLVVANEGTTIKGVCEILPVTRYIYDASTNLEGLSPDQASPRFREEAEFNYTHCLYPVRWIDAADIGISMKAPIRLKGIVGCEQQAGAIERKWNKYKDGLHSRVPWGEAWLRERLRKLRRLQMNKIIDVLAVFPQIILHGPPGTGKTYEALEIAGQLLKLDTTNDAFEKARFSSTQASSAKGRWEIVQFHPSYNYEDFVRGIESQIESDKVVYKAVDKIFARMCDAAQRTSDPYVLIIDEINRANLAAVLGELLYALEYRGKEVTTSYKVDGRQTLLVPNNLYIIGTMNTADRSIGHLDYAIRRRFAFRKYTADPGVIRQFYDDLSLVKREREELRDKALKMFEEVAKLFAKDANYLSPDYRSEDVHVGHTYFMKCKSEDELRMKFTHQVLPLLREYIADGVLLPSSEEPIAKLAASYASDTAHA